MDGMSIGVVNCLRLHVFSEPNADSEIIGKFRYLTRVVVELDKSTEDFYKICTAIGAEGYCQKEHITITQ